MSNFKKLSIALILAVAAVFSATAADACKKACPEAAKLCNKKQACDKKAECPKVAVPANAKLDSKTSDGIFEWYKTDDGRRFLKYVHDKPATIYTVTIPYDGVCKPGRQIMMYHPENCSKGLLHSANKFGGNEQGILCSAALQ